MSKPVDIGDIVAGLTDNAAAVAQALLPMGHREGSEWVEARRSQGGLGDSLKVCISGARAGVWAHFAENQRGDALDLVAYLLFGGDKKRAFRWARDWLGYGGDAASKAANGVRHRRQSRPIDREAAQRKEDAKRAGAAFRIWLDAAPSLAGTLADRYLKSRGLDLAALGRQPSSLRFLAKCFKGDDKSAYPALVAAIAGPPTGEHGGKIVAVHRTYLSPDGRKLPADNAKMTLGRYVGGAIRLWHGERTDPETGEVKRGRRLKDAPAGSSVVITEGIEDGLSVALACPERRVLVAVSLANMAAVVLPPAIEEVIICADNDGDNKHATQGLQRAIEAHARAGRRVLVARSPVGKDLNDALRGGAA